MYDTMAAQNMKETMTGSDRHFHDLILSYHILSYKAPAGAVKGAVRCGAMRWALCGTIAEAADTCIYEGCLQARRRRLEQTAQRSRSVSVVTWTQTRRKSDFTTQSVPPPPHGTPTIWPIARTAWKTLFNFSR